MYVDSEPASVSLNSVQNRYLWNRYKHEEKLIAHQLAPAGAASARSNMANEKWLWHGTTHMKPVLLCKGLDGVDFRMVRCFVN